MPNIKENNNYLDEELEELNETILELEELYSESKEMLNNHIKKNVVKPGSRTNYVFIASQTSNLVSIKEKKIALIKEKVNIEKNREDLRLKIANSNEKNGSDGNNDILKGMFNLITNGKNISNIEQDKSYNEEISNLDELIKNKIANDSNEEEVEKDDSIKSGNIPPINKFINRISKDNLKVVVDNNTLEPYVINEDYQLFPEYSDELNEFKLFFKIDEEYEIAIDDFDNEYELIDLE